MISYKNLIAVILILSITVTVSLSSCGSQKGGTENRPQTTSSDVSEDADIKNDDDVEEYKKLTISNGHFSLSARSFVRLFDAAENNYTYTKMDGDASLFYELTKTDDSNKRPQNVGMMSFAKDADKALSAKEESTENVITKINIFVEKSDDVQPILAGCLCAADPGLKFYTASDLAADIVKKADKDGYDRKGINYAVKTDRGYYYIIISIAKTPVTENNEEKNTTVKNNSNNNSNNNNSNNNNNNNKENHYYEDTFSSTGVSRLTVSSTNVTLNNSSKTISVTVPDSYDDYVYSTIEDSDIISSSWGGWSGSTITLTLIPLSTGNTTVEIYLTNGDSVIVNVSSRVSSYTPDAADYTTLRLTYDLPYTFNDDSDCASDTVLLESAKYKISDNGDGTVNITIYGTMQRKTDRISDRAQIGYSLYVDGEEVRSGLMGTTAPNLNESYSYSLSLNKLQPGNYIIYFINHYN